MPVGWDAADDVGRERRERRMPARPAAIPRPAPGAPSHPANILLLLVVKLLRLLEQKRGQLVELDHAAAAMTCRSGHCEIVKK